MLQLFCRLLYVKLMNIVWNFWHGISFSGHSMTRSGHGYWVKNIWVRSVRGSAVQSVLWPCFRAVLSDNDVLQLDPNIGADYSGAPYPFGMDPVRSSESLCTVSGAPQ